MNTFCTYFHVATLFCCYRSRGISTDVQAARIQNQLAHIEAMLVEAIRHNPTWLLVAGHYPIFSTGEHGDTSELKSYLLPLLTKYKVHAYFCGHDHFSGMTLTLLFRSLIIIKPLWPAEIFYGTRVYSYGR